MAFNDTDINICSRALNAIGAESISSFSEGTTEAKVANNKYQTCKQKLLAIYPWTFNRIEAYIPKITTNEHYAFKNIFEKPKDFLTARYLRENNQKIDFIFVKGKINTDAEKPILVYSADCSESDSKNDDYAQFDKIYQNSLIEARHVDAKSKSPSVIDTSLLIGVR